MMGHIIAVGRTSLRKWPFLGASKSKGDWIEDGSPQPEGACSQWSRQGPGMVGA